MVGVLGGHKLLQTLRGKGRGGDKMVMECKAETAGAWRGRVGWGRGGGGRGEGHNTTVQEKRGLSSSHTGSTGAQIAAFKATATATSARLGLYSASTLCGCTLDGLQRGGRRLSKLL